MSLNAVLRCRWPIAGLLVLATFAACAPPPPVAGPSSPVPEAPVPVAVDPLSAPWVLEPSRATVVQRLQFEASLVSRIDTVERRDTIRTELDVEWSRVSGEGAARVSGLVTAFRVAADTSAPAAIPGLLVPIPFTALDAVGAVPARITRPDPASCALDAAAVLGVRELLLTAPRRLETGATWSDSAQYVICRDSIPLTVGSVRDYRVTGAERRANGIVVLIERRSRVSMRGEGRQFGETITIEAAGEGAAILEVRLAGAFIETATGESTLRMTMRGRRRSQELTQHTRIAIVTP